MFTTHIDASRITYSYLNKPGHIYRKIAQRAPSQMHMKLASETTCVYRSPHAFIPHPEHSASVRKVPHCCPIRRGSTTRLASFLGFTTLVTTSVSVSLVSNWVRSVCHRLAIVIPPTDHGLLSLYV